MVGDSISDCRRGEGGDCLRSAVMLAIDSECRYELRKLNAQKADGAPRLRPSKLSGSTAKLDDSIFLRANVADVRDRSDALGSLSHADLAGQAA